MILNDLKNYDIDIPKNGKVVIDFYTEWCAPCKIISPVLEQFRDEGLIKLIQVDLGEQQELGNKLNIYAVPTLFFITDGELLDKDIQIEGQTIVKKGVMVGAAGEIILKKIIDQM
ncbi:MAG: hypothetical protein GF383_12670 [Candidatus Lokiarchaeota archaeon]|nr:hypothetical protein [Candidatus Lokiarchaeota archaeon]MBD3341912.1 hypothetical protein [Candidatus Lokiarchaeota archaeon]